MCLRKKNSKNNPISASAGIMEKSQVWEVPAAKSSRLLFLNLSGVEIEYDGTKAYISEKILEVTDRPPSLCISEENCGAQKPPCEESPIRECSPQIANSKLSSNFFKK